MTGGRRGADPRRTFRDGQGKFARRTAAANEAAAPDFVFDNRVIEGWGAPAAQPPPLEFHLGDAGAGPDGGFDAIDENPLPDSGRPQRACAPAVPARGPRSEDAPVSRVALSPASRLLAAALLFGAVVFLFQRDHFGPSSSEPSPAPSPVSFTPVATPLVRAQAEPRPTPRAVAPPSRRQEHGPLPVAAGESFPALTIPELTVPELTLPEITLPAQAISEEEGWFSLAEEYLQLGDQQRAEALYRHLYREGTQKGRAALALGDLFTAREDYQRAEEYYSAAQLLFQQSPRPAVAP